MPGVSTEQKAALGKTLNQVKTDTLPKIEGFAKKVETEKQRESVDAKNIDKLKSAITELEKRHERLAVGGTDDSRYQTLRADIAKLATEATKLLRRVQTEATTPDPDAWKALVKTKSGKVAELDAFNSTFQGVLKKIVQARGAGHHGAVTLANRTSCLHWVSGSERIFGEYKNGAFIFVGYGRHTGKGNSSYKVTLVEGGSTTAETS